MKKFLIIAAVLTVAAVIAVPVWISGNTKSVDVTTAKRGEIAVYFESTGEARPSQLSQVLSRANGAVTEVMVSPGDKVQTGDALFTVYSEATGGESVPAAADAAGSSARDESVRKSVVSSAQTYGYELSAFNEVMKNGIGNIAAETDTAFAVSSTAVSKSETVKSDISGSVIAVNAVQGDMVTAAAPVVTIGDTDHMDVYFFVSESDRSKISLDAACELSVNGSDTVYTGKIAEISDVLTADAAGNKSCEVRIVTTDEMNCIAGATVDVSVLTDAKEDTLLIDGDSAITDGTVMIVDEDNLARKRTITTGLVNDDYYEVTSGLSEGDRVILNQDEEINEGERLNIN